MSFRPPFDCKEQYYYLLLVYQKLGLPIDVFFKLIIRRKPHNPGSHGSADNGRLRPIKPGGIPYPTTPAGNLKFTEIWHLELAGLVGGANG